MASVRRKLRVSLFLVGYKDAKRSNVSGYFCAMRMRAAAESGGLDRPCSQRSTVRTGTRIMCAKTALETSRVAADAANGLRRELGERPRLDVEGPEGALAGPVLANLAEPVEHLGGDVAFSHGR